VKCSYHSVAIFISFLFRGLVHLYSSTMASFAFDAEIEQACRDVVIPGAVFVASSADGTFSIFYL
jgi:hypothetical protein